MISSNDDTGKNFECYFFVLFKDHGLQTQLVPRAGRLRRRVRKTQELAELFRRWSQRRWAALALWELHDVSRGKKKEARAQ